MGKCTDSPNKTGTKMSSLAPWQRTRNWVVFDPMLEEEKMSAWVHLCRKAARKNDFCSECWGRVFSIVRFLFCFCFSILYNVFAIQTRPRNNCWLWYKDYSALQSVLDTGRLLLFGADLCGKFPGESDQPPVDERRRCTSLSTPNVKVLARPLPPQRDRYCGSTIWFVVCESEAPKRMFTCKATVLECWSHAPQHRWVFLPTAKPEAYLRIKVWKKHASGKMAQLGPSPGTKLRVWSTSWSLRIFGLVGPLPASRNEKGYGNSWSGQTPPPKWNLGSGEPVGLWKFGHVRPQSPKNEAEAWGSGAQVGLWKFSTWTVHFGLGDKG